MKARSSFTFSMLCLALASAPAVAQDLDRVRALYVSAAYEEALAAMPAVNGEAVRTDLEQYRALCLLALGREAEASAAVERLVRDHPTFVPVPGETSPRMQSLFVTARAKLIPDLARTQYGEAKTAYEKKDRETALAGFRRTISLIDSLAESDRGSLADLRLVAAGFLELSSERSARTGPAAAAPVPGLKTAPSTPEPSGPFVGPVAINEQLPPWSPPDSASRRMEYAGLLRIAIGADGRVESATIVKSSHPVYDMAALRAAKGWTYKPATRGGQPVPTHKDIHVRLVPQ